MTVRGLMSTLLAAVHNWSGAMALRFFLGAFEAAYACVIPIRTHILVL